MTPVQPGRRCYARRHPFKGAVLKICECCSRAISKLTSLPQYEFVSNEEDTKIEWRPVTSINEDAGSRLVMAAGATQAVDQARILRSLDSCGFIGLSAATAAKPDRATAARYKLRRRYAKSLGRPKNCDAMRCLRRSVWSGSALPMANAPLFQKMCRSLQSPPGK